MIRLTRLGIVSAAVLLLACLSLALVACESASGPTAAATAPQPAATTGPALTPTPGTLLRCTAHTSAGQEDDSEQIALTCAVSHAPASETSYTLHFGITDPSGMFHALTPTCAGALQNGAGSCSQIYEFIFPFAANPGPVTGQFAPSGLRFGPVIPTSA